MNIRVFDDIDDLFLKSEWERLETENDIFPQSTHDWCATWWKHLGGRRELHVVMVVDEDGKAAAIAPLCMEQHFGIRVLRSFPIHFGDFYNFIIDKATNSRAVTGQILDFLSDTRRNGYRWVRLEQVCEEDRSLVATIEERGWLSKEMTRCPMAVFAGLEWDEYLMTLSSTYRATVRRRLRKFARTFESEFRCMRSWEDFAPFFAKMLETHAGRWQEDSVPMKGQMERATWELAIRGAFDSGKAVFFALCVEEELVAYRLGFFHGNVYYDWHLSHSQKYAEYSPGIVIVARVIQHLLVNGYEGINFMAGQYDWKLRWCSTNKVTINRMASSPSKNAAALLLNWYHHRLRDKLKSAYHGMMKHRILRRVSRTAIWLRQKLAGTR